MFLNWVYRVNINGGQAAINTCLQSPLPSPDQWLGPGFLNRMWSATHSSFVADSIGIPGELDTRLPGDVRYYFIDNRIRQIFVSKQW